MPINRGWKRPFESIDEDRFALIPGLVRVRWKDIRPAEESPQYMAPPRVYLRDGKRPANSLKNHKK